jgi:hypothetical protein
MHQAIYEEQCISFLEMRFDGAVQVIHTIQSGIVAGIGVGEVGFVAARDHHGGAVAWANVGQGQNDVTLPTAEDAILIIIRPTQRSLKAAGMDRVVAPNSRTERMHSSMKSPAT